MKHNCNKCKFCHWNDERKERICTNTQSKYYNDTIDDFYGKTDNCSKRIVKFTGSYDPIKFIPIEFNEETKELTCKVLHTNAMSKEDGTLEYQLIKIPNVTVEFPLECENKTYIGGI